MPAGIRIKNDDGTFQITDEVPNYALHTITSEFTDSGFPDAAVYAFQPSSGSYMSQHESETLSGRCMVFAPCNDIPYTRPTAGLIGDIRNAADDLMFSVNLRPLVVVDLVEWSSASQEATLVKTYASGRTYAVIYLAEMISEYGQNTLTGIGGEDEQIYESSNTRNTVQFKIESNVITFKYTANQFETWESVETGNGSGIFIPALATEGYYLGSVTISVKALIIDVTEL